MAHSQMGLDCSPILLPQRGLQVVEELFPTRMSPWVSPRIAPLFHADRMHRCQPRCQPFLYAALFCAFCAARTDSRGGSNLPRIASQPKFFGDELFSSGTG